MLACHWDYDGEGWYWQDPVETTLTTKRGRKCCSCHGKISVADTTVVFPRFRGATSEIEERIHGDEVELAPWHMCEECGDMFWSLDALGFCVIIGDQSMRELTKEYADTYS